MRRGSRCGARSQDACPAVSVEVADLVTHLLAADAGGERLTEDELVSTLILLLNAGHEAAVRSLGNAVRAVLLHDAQDAVRDDPDTVVEEVLRWDPPLHLFTRHVYQAVEVAGHALAAGDEAA